MLGYVGTLNVGTLNMLVLIECLYVGYVGTLNVCTLDMLVH